MSSNGENLIEKYDENMKASKVESGSIRWYSPLEEPFYVAGFAWREQDHVYRRLPVRPSHKLPEAVDFLAGNTAGGQIKFQSTTSHLSIRVKLNERANMTHMPATGQCGFDCYVEAEGEFIFSGVSKYPVQDSEYETVLFSNYGTELKNIVLHFPLYMGVEEVFIGLDEEAVLTAPPAYLSQEKVIIYGTSITQGGCAARPGMAYTNILSRRIPLEFINLGFSGSGKGEPELAHNIAEIENPALLVLDYEANSLGLDMLKNTMPEFVRIYREKHPDTPILVVSKIAYAQEVFNPVMREEALQRRAFQEGFVQQCRQKGDQAIYFFDGSQLLGDTAFHECTVDGVHPTDLGFLRMADGLTPIFRQLLQIVD
ncbi:MULTISPECIES: SGNH/GDSL hydrolase family protein [unclassified Paenibacillus]|uniref:SGNH/GDSL hydrolase family protein n=1 Tax=unclassified Paenibacillus TaxID=185978 RepID=UPI002F3EAAC5